MASDQNIDQETAAPRLRTDVEFIPVIHEGRRALLIRDPLELAPGPVLVREDAFSLLGLLDGKSSLAEIQVAMVRLRDGLFVSAAEVSGMVDELEGAGILESPRIAALRERMVKDYVALEVRPAYHAGRAYPRDRGELEALLDRILASGQGAAPLPAPGPAKALVAPHIDLEAGRRAYAAAYGALRDLPPPRRVLLLGTGHGLDDEFFSLTDKDFETPLGRVRTDKAAVRRMRESAGRSAAPDDFGHRAEHSLEFQLLFLQRLFGSEFDLLPVLFGSFREELPRRRRAADIPGAQGVLAFMEEYAFGSGPDALVVAGVDLSHIGPKFGHDLSAAALSAETRRHDRKLLEALCRAEADAFWEEMRVSGDRYNVCGFSALACLLEILLPAGLSGRLLAYDLRREQASRSAVSFASVAFFASDGGPATKENAP